MNGGDWAKATRCRPRDRGAEGHVFTHQRARKAAGVDPKLRTARTVVPGWQSSLNVPRRPSPLTLRALAPTLADLAKGSGALGWLGSRRLTA